jgi:hypothetical protein
MEILETLRNIGYTSPAQTWIQMRAKLSLDDLTAMRRKNATLYDFDATIAILQRWADYKSSGSHARVAQAQPMLATIAKEIASIKSRQETNKRKREELGVAVFPEHLPRHVQLHREGYGFLVLWQVASVAYKKEVDDSDDVEEAPDTQGTLSSALQFRVSKFETAKKMSELISQHLSDASLPEVIVQPSKRSSDLASKMTIFHDHLEKASYVVRNLRPLLEAMQKGEGPAVFASNLVGVSPKLYLLLAGCSPRRPDGEDKREIRTVGDVTDLMYMKLASVLHANGDEMVVLAGRHCGLKCVEYRKKSRHAGKCERFDGPENEDNSIRFQRAAQGEFEEDYISFYSKTLEMETMSSGLRVGQTYVRYVGKKIIIPIFMGQHAAAWIGSIQLMEMQHTMPHGYGPHFTTCNQINNAEKSAGVFTAFGSFLKAETIKEWWLDICRNNKVHEKGILTLIANSHANSIDSTYKVKLEERTPNGKDCYAMCTACNKKVIHGNWTLHVKTKDHKKNVDSSLSSSSSSTL